MNFCVDYEDKKSEENELLLNISFDSFWLHSQEIEPHSLAKGSALANSHNVSFSHSEGWGGVHWDVSVSLLKPVVLLDVVQVVPPDDNGPLHLG